MPGTRLSAGGVELWETLSLTSKSSRVWGGSHDRRTRRAISSGNQQDLPSTNRQDIGPSFLKETTCGLRLESWAGFGQTEEELGREDVACRGKSMGQCSGLGWNHESADCGGDYTNPCVIKMHRKMHRRTPFIYSGTIFKDKYSQPWEVWKPNSPSSLLFSFCLDVSDQPPDPACSDPTSMVWSSGNFSSGVRLCDLVQVT